ncbi:hypothetical protein AB0C34_17255 [Nocardia sp. NPDC049220]|uniref:hypothetical protein n=1 Tax=Nocardia sp. NPDC049220 TaxID=3155273 RepID=UPI0033D4778E
MTATATAFQPHDTSLKAVPATPSTPMRKPLPRGKAKKWYQAVNRRRRAAKLVLALLDQGIYTPSRATNGRIRKIATQYNIGGTTPSDITCELVRQYLRAAAR